MKTASALMLILAATVAPAIAAGPVWDNSGNSQLSGTYYFRQVLYVTDGSGNTSRAITLYGNIAFSGNSAGTYTLSGLAGADSSSGSPSIVSSTGTYSVSASGYGFLSSPVISGASEVFLVSNHILVGSATESGYNDMFIAAPYTSNFSNSSFNGSYTISSFFPSGTPATVTDATYQLNPNGAGLISGNVSITGYTGAATTLTQTASNVKYNFVNGANVITFPTNTNANFYSGQVYMYLSPDSNFVFGGTPNGYDMFVGVRNAASGTSTTLSGLYYETGFDENESSGLDSYYGSFNAFQGNILGHERLVYSNGGSANGQGYTYYNSYPTSIANTYQDPSGTTQYTIGQSGVRIGFGIIATISGVQYAYPSIEVALPYSPQASTGTVYVDPTGIVNTASSAPYTAGVSPGDFVTLYNGVNLANATVFAQPGAFPTTLGGVKVLVDGLAAPLYYVSASQISFLIPYSVTTFPVVSIQVSNNGVLSNIATTYWFQTTPGVFTSNPVGGDGIAAMLDYAPSGAFHVVSTSNPAQPGDVIALYLTGLGTPFPSNGDGALGPDAGDILVNDVQIDVGGTGVGNLAYAGLAPDLAGLYQVNFTMPALCGSPAVQPCINSGTNSLGVTGIAVVGNSSLYDSYSNESLIPVGTGATAKSTASAAIAEKSSNTALKASPRTLPRLKTSAPR